MTGMSVEEALARIRTSLRVFPLGDGLCIRTTLDGDLIADWSCDPTVRAHIRVSVLRSASSRQCRLGVRTSITYDTTFQPRPDDTSKATSLLRMAVDLTVAVEALIAGLPPLEESAP